MKVLVFLMLVCLSWVYSANLSCNCGLRNTGRIVGGKETRKNEYPWVAHTKNGCGGSIITPYHVLTAAHCTANKTPLDLEVSVGMHYKLFGQNPHLQVIRVARIIQHQGYRHSAVASPDDISILVLASPIRFNQFVGPVCLPSSRFNLVGKFIKVIGWGSTEDKWNENVLREVDLQIIPNHVCKLKQPYLDSRPTQLCAYTPRKDSCYGDSGGPLVYLDPATNRFTQAALVSYGPDKCGVSPIPSVNTDVFAYIDWIKQAVAQTYPREKICTKI